MDETVTRYRCTLTPEGAEDRVDSDRALAGRVQDTERLEQGVRVTFGPGEDTRRLVDAFVDNERRCCGFFAFEVGQESGSVTLEITAPAAEPAQAMVDAAKHVFDRGVEAIQPESL